MSIHRVIQQAASNAGGLAESDYIYAGDATNNGTVYVLDHTTPGTITKESSITGSAVGDIPFSLDPTPDNQYLAMITSNPNIYIYDISNPASISLASTFNAAGSDNLAPFPSGGRFSNDGAYFAACVDTTLDKVNVYSFSSGTLTFVTSFTTASGSEIKGVSWSPDDDYLFCSGGNSDRSVQLLSFNGSTISHAATFVVGGGTSPDPQGVGFSPDGSYVASVTNNSSGVLSLLNRSGGSLSSATSYAVGNASSLSWHPEGDYIVVGLNQSPFVSLFDHTTPGSLSLAASFPTYSADRGVDVKFTASGKYIAVCGGNIVTLLDHTTPGSLSLADTYSGSTFRAVATSKAG